MTAVEIMAAALEQELRARGVSTLDHADCEAMLRRMLSRAAAEINTMPMSAEEAAEISRRST